MYKIISYKNVNIYLSNLEDASNLDKVKENDIKTIFRLGDLKCEKVDYGDSIVAEVFELEDNTWYVLEMFEAATKIIHHINTLSREDTGVEGNIEENKGKNVLIHCNQGQSRSVTVICFLMMLNLNMTYTCSFDYIKKIKGDIRPNNRFILLMKQVESCSNDIYKLWELHEKLKLENEEYAENKYLFS
jgi:protein tyrosine/serine phosphatase